MTSHTTIYECIGTRYLKKSADANYYSVELQAIARRQMVVIGQLSHLVHVIFQVRLTYLPTFNLGGDRSLNFVGPLVA